MLITCAQVVEQNFTYHFNVCGTVTGSVPSTCSSLAGLSKAGALQVDKRVLTDLSDDYCFVTGEYSDRSTTVELLDQSDPSLGLALTYFGTYCNHPAVQRQFRVELQCADKLSPVPTHALEYQHCSYTVTMPSVYGCPLECPVSDRHLCAGNGHCAYDHDRGGARCFCDQGFRGVACAQEEVEGALNYSPALLGLIITLFAIIGLLVGKLG